MARPGQLANAIAEVLGLDQATVRQQARLLRDAGQLSMERGGRGGGSMTPRDAVNLLLAAAGSSKVKYSVRPVEQHGSCRSDEGAWELPFSGLPELLALNAKHTFSDALEALLCAALNGSIIPGKGNLGLTASLAVPIPQGLTIAVRVREPFVEAEIEFGILHYGENNLVEKVETVQRHYRRQWTAGGPVEPAFEAVIAGDLTHIHSFTHNAIFRIAQEFIAS
jgi:DNA-binding transcriptional ArsR family regulator